MINQVQGSGITTEQQKKTWLINWYFANDPMGSIYLATLRNPSIVASYHPDSYRDSPGLLYGSTFTQSMENYFIKIKNHFGQSMFDQLVTEFAQQSNLYVDEIKVDEPCPPTGRWHLYGCSDALHGVDSKRVARDLNLDNQITSNEYVIETPEEVTYLFSSYQLERGAKRYELSNHLGNVLTVISDKKTAVFTGSTFSYFSAERISATDYSPFGAPLASRTWNGGEYRFGFNSMENDNEINGTGNAYDFGARIYSAILGKWLSIDLLQKNYPDLSPFNGFGNNPIIFVDKDGKEIVIGGSAEFREKVFQAIQKLTNDKLVIDENGKVTIIANANEPSSNKNFGTGLVSQLVNTNNIIEISETGGLITNNANSAQGKDMGAYNGKGTGTNIIINGDELPKVTEATGNKERAPVEIVVGHELIHASDNDKGQATTIKGFAYDPDNPGIFSKSLSKDETKTRKRENILRREQGLTPRAEPSSDIVFPKEVIIKPKK